MTPSESLLPKDDTSTYIPIERQLEPILRGMESEGVRVNPAQFATLEPTRKALLDKMHQLAGFPFRPEVRHDLVHLFYDRLGCTPDRVNGRERIPSVDQTALEFLAGQHALASMVLQYNELTRLIDFYVTQLPLLIDEGGRMHFHFTMRWSLMGRIIADPTMPDDTPSGRIVRRGIVASKNWRLIRLVFTQPAIHILAHQSGDMGLTAACQTGDAHAAVAQAVWGDPTKRTHGKAINYAIIHGLGRRANTMAHGLRCSVKEALRATIAYHEAYPRVDPYREQVRQEAVAALAATTTYGRRRDMPLLATDTVNFHKRFAFAFRIYGTEADMMKEAIVRIVREGYIQGVLIRPLAQVQDEILFEAPSAQADTASALIAKVISTGLGVGYPQPFTETIGSAWAERGD